MMVSRGSQGVGAGLSSFASSRQMKELLKLFSIFIVRRRRKKK
jgi:hypothetical protein